MQLPRWQTPDPPGVTGTYGPKVAQWARRELGTQLDPWQRYILDRVLRHDRRGDLVHRTALWSTARQNGKSVIVRTLYDWFLDPDAGGKVPAFASWEAITAAAHDAKQARVIYKGVYKDLRKVKRLTHQDRRTDRQRMAKPPVYLTLQAGIQSADRLTFDISTSEANSSRSFSYGAIAWDELLTQRDWSMHGALAPTQMMQRSPIMLLTSTAGFVDSIVLRDFYDRLVRQASGAEAPDPTFFGAWWESEDPDAGLDWRAIRQANPSPRLPKAAVEAEFRTFPPDQWKRERLNHWIDEEAIRAIGAAQWARCRQPDPLDVTDGPFAVGVDIGPRWERATVTVAGVRPDGRIGAVIYRELVENVTAESIVDTVHGFPGIDQTMAIVYDGASGGAAAFARAATEVGWPWTVQRPNELVAASMDVTELIMSGRLAVDDPVFDAQIATTGRRDVGQDGAFRFSRAHSTGPIDAILAMTMAVHTIAKHAAPSIYVPTDH